MDRKIRYWLGFVVWPLLLSMLVAYVTAFITLKVWRTRKRYSQLRAMLLVIAVFGLILMVRVKPASYYVDTMDTGQRIISVERVMSSAARAVMNNNGSSSTIIAPLDYLPFCEEVASGT